MLTIHILLEDNNNNNNNNTLTNSMVYGTRKFNAASIRLSNNLYPEPNLFLVLITISSRYILILSSHGHIGHPKSLFTVYLRFKILKELRTSFILAIWPYHLMSNLLDLITLTILGAWVQNMKFFILEPSPTIIIFLLRPKYSPQDPVFKYP